MVVLESTFIHMHFTEPLKPSWLGEQCWAFAFVLAWLFRRGGGRRFAKYPWRAPNFEPETWTFDRVDEFEQFHRSNNTSTDSFNLPRDDGQNFPGNCIDWSRQFFHLSATHTRYWLIIQADYLLFNSWFNKWMCKYGDDWMGKWHVLIRYLGIFYPLFLMANLV